MSVDPDSAAPVGSAVPTDPVAPSTGPSFHPTLPTVLHSSAAHPNFYIGEIGGGLTADSTYFDSAAAAAVGPEYTFTVWALEGYNSQFRPSGDSAEQWGGSPGKRLHQRMVKQAGCVWYDVIRGHREW